MDSVVHFLAFLGLVALGLWLASMKWKSLKPLLKAYLALLRVSAIGVLYAMYYLTCGVVRVLQAIAKTQFSKRGNNVSARDRQSKRRP